MKHSIIISLDKYNNMKAELEKLREIDFYRTIPISITMQGKTYHLQATPAEAKDTDGFHTLSNKIKYHLKDLITENKMYQNKLEEQEKETLDAIDRIDKLRKYIKDSDNELYKFKKEHERMLKRHKRIEVSQRYAIVVLIAICLLSLFAHYNFIF